ncbi:hypothetical protein KEJ36_06000, partial [Candidatus Bathyarchaeota archaeon]|nr:hypothetical protein [Candidatus Bathyarchaeota archaeon]
MSFILKREGIAYYYKYIMSKGYSLFAPVKEGSRHSFRKMDEDKVGEISLDYVRTTMPPLKILLIPPKEVLFRVKNGKIEEALPDPESKTAVLGVHPCDVNAMNL